MANVGTLDRFIFNSDFPADMITYKMSAEFDIPAGAAGTQTFSHSLGYIPLCFGIWAKNADFSDAVPLSDGWFGIQVSSTNSQIKLKYDFSTQTSATHVYVRVYGFAPSTYVGDTPSTARSSSALILNTDLNYSPLLFEGAFTTHSISDISQQINLEYNVKTGYIKKVEEGNSLTIYHDLPHRPNVMFWAEQNGEVKQPSGATFDYWGGWYSISYPDVSFNDDSVFVNLGDGWSGSPIITTHIRVYA